MQKPSFYAPKANDEYSDIGPRNAAVLTFSGNSSNSIVKELTQNSLDARADRRGKLRIHIREVEIPKKDIPNFSEFEEAINLMEAYWNSKGNQYRTFFKTAKKSIEGSKVKMFVFEDFMTKGLEGDDNEGTFKFCVNDENVSGKSHSDSLGNHGIGKNSVFGYSGVQTVYYSSLNDNGSHKFKGVTKLGSFLDSKGIKRSERMYYGLEGEKGVKLVSDPQSIPEVFRRTEIGLSQYVVGAELQEGWSDNIKCAFLENYWLLFETDILTVSINDEILDKSNFEEEAIRLFNEDSSKENPIPYIKTYKSTQIFKTKKIHKIGNVNLYLNEETEGDVFPNKIVFLRDGMKIKMDPLRVSGLPINIAGVIFCDNPNGNSILGAMEPHAHDQFLPELVAKKEIEDVTVSDAKQILYEINAFKKEVLLNIKKQYTEETENVDIVDELFSKILGIGTGSSSGKTNETKKESFNKKIVSLDYNGEFSSSKRNSVINNNEEADLGEGEGPGAGTGTGGKGIHIGTGQNKGDQKGGSAKSDKKNPGKIKHNITSRFFLSESESDVNTYNLVLRSPEDISEIDIVIGQKGDSEKVKQMSSELVSAKSAGRSLNFKKNTDSNNDIISFNISGISIKEDVPEIIEIKMMEKKKSALKLIETK